MSDMDYLAAAVGALEGFNKAYTPYKTLETEDLLARRRKTEEQANESNVATTAFGRQKELADYTAGLAPIETHHIIGDKGTDLVPPIIGGPRENISITKIDEGKTADERAKQQDALEEKARTRLSGIRGDKSLANVESQRDAAIQAYNTIEQIKKDKRMPSQIEYYDILGQLWKARTGASPTDQAIRDLDAKTLKGDLGKASQYFTGKPAGRTTAAILQNIQDFAKNSGLQADKLHEGYMQTHLDLPTSLESSRAESLKKLSRGTSFSDATGANNLPTGWSAEEEARLQELENQTKK